MADSYGLGAQHPAPAEVGADAEPGIYDPVAEHTDAERDDAAKAVERSAARSAAERYEHRRTTAPWQRTGPREIAFRDDYWLSNNPPFLGPFGPGDMVTINGDVTGVIEFVTSKGLLVMPEIGPGACHLGHWVVGENIVSIRPVGWVEKGTPRADIDTRVVADSREGDESLPMRPPPVQPGGEATFR